MGGAPNAISVSPSKYFLGDDGNFNAFQISVGTPPTQLLVLPSTLVPVSWVILSQGCTINDNPACNTLRGNLFNQNSSTTWKDVNSFTLGVETSLGWDSKDAGNFGYDKLSIAASQGAVAVDNAVVAGITTTDSYVGQLGLASRNVTMGTEAALSLLSNLRNASQIPSISYSYTAGAFYNSTQSDHTYTGSLTLGGFDAARSKPNDFSFDFGPDDTNYLNVGLQSMTFTNGGKSQNLLKDPITVNIDSTVSAMYLPNDTCNAIAAAYGLQYQPLNGWFTVNSSQHTQNTKNNPQLSLSISNTMAGGGPTVSINFPYGAFDVNFTNPTDAQADPLQIFPMRALTSSQEYTLGRTFLQEAVLTVDFERKNFSLAQAVPPSSNSQPQIVNIISPTDAGNGGSSTGTPSSPTSTNVTAVAAPSSFPTGAIAGIVIGVIAIIAAALAFFFLRRRRQHKLRRRGPIAVGTPVTEGPNVSQKLLPPELANQDGRGNHNGGGDYFSVKSGPPQYQARVSENEIASASELESPKLNDGSFVTHHSPHGSPPIIAGPAELPDKDPTASELNSRSVSMNSALAQFAGFSSFGAAGRQQHQGGGGSPSELGRQSSPTTGAHEPWTTSNLEHPSPTSASPVSFQKAPDRARLVTHNKVAARSPRHGSNQSSIDQNGMSAITTGPLGYDKYEPLSSEAAAAQQQQGDAGAGAGDISGNKRDSQNTLIGGGGGGGGGTYSGRASPEMGTSTGQTNPSAFTSPALMPIQRFDPPQEQLTTLHGAEQHSGGGGSLGDLEEGLRR